jgi:D-alanyl-D-alanine carboxypeptidase/D-alanyl-D-alanine carboxypeptidase (penicillin-binding protein 5/6)
MEAATGQIVFARNADVKLPMASTTKIMTTLLALEHGAKTNTLDTEFVVDENAIKVEGSSMGLRVGDVVTLRTLCYGMLLPSGNDAAGAVAVKIAGSYEDFAKLMNARAAEIGMTRTFFVTPSGLDDTGHGASAHDMALLAREALKNAEFRAICSQKSASVKFGNPPYDRRLNNTNRLLDYCEGIIGVKTGFTDAAGRCLVSAATRNGITLIIVTLFAPSDWEDHTKLYDFAFPLLARGELNGISESEKIFAEVVGSDKDRVGLETHDAISYGYLAGTENNAQISTRLIMPPFLYAPIENGDEVAELEIYCNDVLVGTLPLYAKENAPLMKKK